MAVRREAESSLHSLGLSFAIFQMRIIEITLQGRFDEYVGACNNPTLKQVSTKKQLVESLLLECSNPHLP